MKCPGERESSEDLWVELPTSCTFLCFLLGKCLSLRVLGVCPYSGEQSHRSSVETVKINEERTCQPVRIWPSGTCSPSPFPAFFSLLPDWFDEVLVSGFPVHTVLRTSEPESRTTHSIKLRSRVWFGLTSYQILLLCVQATRSPVPYSNAFLQCP